MQAVEGRRQWKVGSGRSRVRCRQWKVEGQVHEAQGQVQEGRRQWKVEGQVQVEGEGQRKVEG